MPTAALNWKPYAWGVLAAALLWGGFYLHSVPTGHRDDAYAGQLAILDARVSRAESDFGGITYWDATLDNRGDRSLTGFTVRLTFLDTDGKPVQQDQRIVLDQRFRPIPPHSQRAFQVAFDNVAPEWNQAPPEAQAVAVYIQ